MELVRRDDVTGRRVGAVRIESPSWTSLLAASSFPSPGIEPGGGKLQASPSDNVIHVPSTQSDCRADISFGGSRFNEESFREEPASSVTLKALSVLRGNHNNILGWFTLHGLDR